MADLFNRKIQSVIVEGGSFTLQSFINAGLWDEIRIFKAATNFGSGISAPRFVATKYDTTQLGTDVLEIYRNPASSGH